MAADIRVDASAYPTVVITIFTISETPKPVADETTDKNVITNLTIGHDFAQVGKILE